MVIIYVILMFNNYLFVATDGGGCTFPLHWTGSWFQSGVAELITINATHIYKATCREFFSNHTFLLYDKNDECYKCIKIHERHYNVLEYRESYCSPKDPSPEVCEDIIEEVAHFWLFRKEPKPMPEKCPFRPTPFTFTYNRGTGDCGNPVAQAESCSDDSRLLLRYTACPDERGTKTYDEQLECLATWKEGSRTFLVGQISPVQQINLYQSDEDTYRCFIYTRKYVNGVIEYNIGQSGAATCKGLMTPSDGSRNFKFISDDKSSNKFSGCQFPDWIVKDNRWFNSTHQYNFTNNNSNIKIIKKDDSYVEKILSCITIRKQLHENYILVFARSLVGCKAGFNCLQMFHDIDGTLKFLQTETDFFPNPNHCIGKLNKSSVTFLEFSGVTSTPRAGLLPHEVTSFGRTNKEVDIKYEIAKSKGKEDRSSAVPIRQQLDEIDRRLNVLENKDMEVEFQDLEAKNSITQLESKLNVLSSKVALIERWITRPLKPDL